MCGTIPFLSLFFLEFGYMGIMSIMQTASGKRLLGLWRPLAEGAKTLILNT
jgi:hypothetical protein